MEQASRHQEMVADLGRLLGRLEAQWRYAMGLPVLNQPDRLAALCAHLGAVRAQITAHTLAANAHLRVAANLSAGIASQAEIRDAMSLTAMAYGED